MLEVRRFQSEDRRKQKETTTKKHTKNTKLTICFFLRRSNSSGLLLLVPFITLLCIVLQYILCYVRVRRSTHQFTQRCFFFSRFGIQLNVPHDRTFKYMCSERCYDFCTCIQINEHKTTKRERNIEIAHTDAPWYCEYST